MSAPATELQPSPATTSSRSPEIEYKIIRGKDLWEAFHHGKATQGGREPDSDKARTLMAQKKLDEVYDLISVGFKDTSGE